MRIENENTFLAACRHSVNLFLGSGFSTLAKDAQGQFLPVGSQLSNELQEVFGLKHLSNLELKKLCTIINATNRERLKDFLIKRFTVNEFDQRYENIQMLKIRTVFTTNIDNLLHRIFEESTEFYINDIDRNGPMYRDRRAIDLFTLHGSVLYSLRPLRFGALDVASSFGADPDRWRYLQVRLKQFPTIFLGYSLEDAATLEALAGTMTAAGASFTDTWIMVHPSHDNTGLSDYFRALGLQIITGDTEEFLEYIRSNFPKEPRLITPVVSRQTNVLFPKYAVPLPRTVPVREISDFFRGSAPVWNDIFLRTFLIRRPRTVQ